MTSWQQGMFSLLLLDDQFQGSEEPIKHIPVASISISVQGVAKDKLSVPGYCFGKSPRRTSAGPTLGPHLCKIPSVSAARFYSATHQSTHTDCKYLTPIWVKFGHFWSPHHQYANILQTILQERYTQRIHTNNFIQARRRVTPYQFKRSPGLETNILA